MKKNLFKGVSVLGAVLLLANVALPGLAYASTEAEPGTNWEFVDFEAYHGEGTASWVGTYDVPVIDGDTITYSNLSLNLFNCKDDWTNESLGRCGLVGVLYFAPAEGEGDGDSLYFGGHTWNQHLGILNASKTAGDPRYSVGDWYPVTVDNVKEALAGENKELTYSYITSGTNTLNNYTIKIKVDNLTLMSGGNEEFKVESGKIVVEGGKNARWEMVDWKTNKGSYSYGDYETVVDGDTLTFSGLNLKRLNITGIPGKEEPVKGGLVGVLYFAPRSEDEATLTFSGRTFAERLADESASYTAEDPRYSVADWYWVTPEDVEDALAKGQHELSRNFPVVGTETKNYVVNINIDNVKIYSGDDVNDVWFQTVNGEIVTIDGEDAFTVNFEGSDIADLLVASGSNVVEPETPTKECNSFDGWFVDSAYSTGVEFPLTVIGDTTIYAKWTYTCSRSSGGGGGGSSKSSASSSNESKTAEKATDTAKADEQKADDAKADENKNEAPVAEETAAPTPMTEAQAVEKFGQEQIDAYKWAHDKGITTMDTVEDARLDQPLTRAELAKMMVVYMAKIAKKSPVVTGTVSYPDVKAEEIGDELVGYIQLAYQFQIMGVDANGNPIEEFMPNALVTRGEYATVFSRVLFGSLFNQEGEDFYSKHIAALNAAGILTNTDPTIQEMRGWVMLMMYRSSQNLEEIAKVAAEIGATDEEVEAGKKAAEILAEEEAKAETTTGDVAEAPVAEEQAQATTGDVAEVPAVEETASAEANTGDVAAEPSNN